MLSHWLLICGASQLHGPRAGHALNHKKLKAWKLEYQYSIYAQGRRKQLESGEARQCHKQLSSCRFCIASYIST